MLKRAFSFVRLTARVASRTKLEEKLEKINRKEYVRRQSPIGKAWYYLHTHKKKNIFFGLLFGLAYYYELHMRIYRWFTVITPLERVQRTIMKKKINPNAWLCVEPESYMRPEVHKALVEFFLEKDRELDFGLPRGALVDIAREQHWVEDRDKFIGAFLWESGYRKESKQRKSSMRLDQFLNFFDWMKTKTQQDDSQLLGTFLEKIPEKLQAARERATIKKGKAKAREAEALERAKEAFAKVEPAKNTELEELERESERIFMMYAEIADKLVKKRDDDAKMKKLEWLFIQKEAKRSQIYS